MKTKLGWRIVGMTVIAFLLMGSVGGVLSQTSPGNPIMITVSTKKHVASEGSGPHPNLTSEMRTEKLEITLQNPTSQAYSGLTLRYCIFDKDLHTHKIASALQHESSINLPSGATLTITSEVASIKFEVNNKPHPNKKGGAEPAKEREFAGYGVELLQADVVVGQSVSPQERTNQLSAVFSGAKKNAH